MTLKVIFERKTERILGAQVVGFDGVISALMLYPLRAGGYEGV